MIRALTEFQNFRCSGKSGYEVGGRVCEFEALMTRGELFTFTVTVHTIE